MSIRGVLAPRASLCVSPVFFFMGIERTVQIKLHNVKLNNVVISTRARAHATAR